VRLNIEADGIKIKQQRSSKRHEEVKLIAAYKKRKRGNH